jgi:hypothetical protein
MDPPKSILSPGDSDPPASNDSSELNPPILQTLPSPLNSPNPPTLPTLPTSSHDNSSHPATQVPPTADSDSDSDESSDSDLSDDDAVEDDNAGETYDPDNLTPIGDAECCICMDSIRLPLVLPCRHQFCYLCLKAAYDRNPVCPLCRRRIPPAIVENAKVRETQIPFTKVANRVPVVWFYSGRTGGWWAYDPTIADEIEQHYQRSLHDPTLTTCTIWMLGRAYAIDFATMEQRTHHARRRIKRETDVAALQGLAKGVAGMKLMPSSNS